MPPRIDHFCALVENYKAAGDAQEPGGRRCAHDGPGALGMAADPDGLRLQLSGRARRDWPAPSFRPRGFHRMSPRCRRSGSIILCWRFRIVEKSAAYYRKFFGMEVSRTKKPERIVVPGRQDRLGLETVAAGKDARRGPRLHQSGGFRSQGRDRKTEEAGSGDRAVQ